VVIEHESPWARLRDKSLIRNKSFIDGQWVSPNGGATFSVEDPATGELLGELPRMGAEETADAIAAAGRAFHTWRVQPARSRGHILRRWADLMVEHADDLAAIVSMEQGKPKTEAKGEVVYGASFLEWFAEEGRRAYGDVIPSSSADQRIVVLKQPVGVVAGITPWNLPAAMVARKVAPALAAGCTMVLKPAEQTPFIALAICELGVRAGVPAGVFNVVLGDTDDAPSIGAELTGNPNVRKIGFTGSIEVGKLLMAQCAQHVKGLALELGGNSAFIVFEDADVEAAVDGLMAAKFRNAGQLCTGANRIFVQEGIVDRFIEVLTARVAKLNVGRGLDPGVDMGPLIDDRALDKVQRHVADLVDRGSTIIAGGDVGSPGEELLPADDHPRTRAG
jgi:succinate-semialdehyde dehydrogenase/glutarate-semialdehyde dehydrogenase